MGKDSYSSITELSPDSFPISGPWSSLWALEFVPTVEYVASGHNSGITDETPFWALVEVG